MIYVWELRRALRSPLQWILMALVFAAFIWATQSTARLHHAQTAALAQIAAD